MLTVPEFSRLLSLLNQTKLKEDDKAQYEFLKKLLYDIKQFADLVAGEINASPIPGILNQPFLFAGDPLPLFPLGRDLLPGTGITFDDSVPNERTVNSSGGGSGYMPMNVGDLFMIMGDGEPMVIPYEFTE